jgi:hypothetical protein
MRTTKQADTFLGEVAAQVQSEYHSKPKNPRCFMGLREYNYGGEES